MHRVLATAIATAALALAAGPAGASTTLGFDGDVCASAGNGIGAFTACGNGGWINQGYGDTSEVDFSFASAAESTTSMSFWFDAYSGLERVAYGGVPVVTMTALAGSTLTLQSFQLGAWPNTNRASQVTVTELVTGNVLLSSGAITVLGTTPSLFTLNASSTRGFQIVFGPDGFNVGIDNITFTATPIPEPGTWALLAAGLALVGAAARRRAV